MNLGKYIDDHGLLDKVNNADGGDTCQREGMFWALCAVMDLYSSMKWIEALGRSPGTVQSVFKALHVTPGNFLRHSNRDYDASDFDRMSRDQLQAAVIGLGYWLPGELWKAFKGHAMRGFIFTNNVRINGATKKNHGKVKNDKGELYNYGWKFPDFTGPEIFGNFMRGFKAWWFHPFYLITDIEILGGAIKWRWFRKHNIALNHTLSQMQSLHRYPSFFAYLAELIMPVDKLVEICGDHMDDPYVEMPFFHEMFKDAAENIKISHLSATLSGIELTLFIWWIFS